MKHLITLFIIIPFSIFLLNNSCYAQNEARIWYFGEYAGLEFTELGPVPLFNSAMHQNEGCASIADQDGVLQFYTDGDGLNDVLIPVTKYEYIRNYHMSIFNRWGELVFETNNIYQGWDGTYRASQLSEGFMFIGSTTQASQIRPRRLRVMCCR